MSSPEDQLNAVVQAAVEHALEQANTAFEKRVEGLVNKNQELLAEKKKLEGKPLTEEQKEERHRAFMDRTDRLLKLSETGPKPAKADKVVFDPNEHSASQYQIMKAEADKRGVPFHVLTRAEASRAAIDLSAVEQFDDALSGVRYVRRDLLDRYSPIRLHQMAEKENLKLKVFRTRDELPENAIPLHDKAAKGGE